MTIDSSITSQRQLQALPGRSARTSGQRLFASVYESTTARMILRRLIGAVLVVWGVTLVTFLVLNSLPGDAATALAGEGEQDPRAAIAKLQRELHLDQPLWTRYWDWLTGAVHGDLGTSLVSKQSVSGLIIDRLPVTAEVVLLGFLVALIVSVPLAILAAGRPGKLFDKLTTGVNMMGLSIAPYVMALLLVLLFAVKLRLLPALGWVSPGTSLSGNLRAMILPALSLGLPLGCFYMRLYRGDIVEQMEGEDYIMTARSKGLAGWRVLVQHGARNSLFGLITVMGLNIGILFGNSVIVESIFGLPGIGQELYSAIETRDVTIVEGVVAVFAVIVVIANLIVDLLYMLLDPRVRYGKSNS